MSFSGHERNISRVCGTIVPLVPAGALSQYFDPFSSELDSQETAGVPGIVFPTSSIHDYATKEYHLSMTRCKWAVHEVFLGNRQWVDEIVALETEFLIQLPVSTATYGGSDRFRLLRDFMKFVSRISAYAMWLIIGPQFPQSYCQTAQHTYRLRRHWEEDSERRGAILGVNSQITPGLGWGIG